MIANASLARRSLPAIGAALIGSLSPILVHGQGQVAPPAATQMTIEDKVIAIAIVLFILSQVTERLANLIKLSFPQPSYRDKPGASRWLGNLKVREGNKEDEKNRERGVLVLSIVCGIVVATVTLLPFNCGQNPAAPPTGMEWLSDTPWWWMYAILAGLFISFGSKFWHDALDLLYTYKLAKQKIADPATYKQESAEAVAAYVKLRPSEIADLAYDTDDAKALRSTPGVTSMGVTAALINGESVHALKVHVSDPTIKVPDHIEVKAEGAKCAVPVIVEHAGLLNAMAGGRVGQGIHNVKRQDRTGTFGCVVHRSGTDRRFILSCYHVMRDKHDWAQFAPQQSEEIAAAGNGTIAKLVAGIRTNRLDSAIAEIPPGVDIEETLPDGKKISGYRTLTPSDVHYSIPLWVKGHNMDHPCRARLCELDFDACVGYADGGAHWLEDLIVITDLSTGSATAPTKRGDSGAIVYDGSAKAVGMVVAGDDKYTYAIPIARVLSQHNVSL